jgi:hypothetical protein
MRKLGSALMPGGLALGMGVGLAMAFGFTLESLPWIVAVGITKLTLLASAGLMGAGAICHRLAARDERLKALEGRSGVDQTTPSLRS